MVMLLYKDKCTSKCVSPWAMEATTSTNPFTSAFYLCNVGLHGSMLDSGRSKSNGNWLLWN